MSGDTLALDRACSIFYGGHVWASMFPEAKRRARERMREAIAAYRASP